MVIPESLQKAIEIEASKYDFHSIAEAREDLTDKYRSGRLSSKSFMRTEAEKCAYIIARMPATYSVNLAVLNELTLKVPENGIKSLLDLGSGPGTAMWAATELYPDLETITLIEKDTELCNLAKRLASSNPHPAAKNCIWKNQGLESVDQFPVHDLVILSYVVGELPEPTMHAVVEHAWNAANKFLIIIEPGTPAGFARIRSLRSQLIALGSYMVAPCPHTENCPMADGDWCHFYQRVERTRLHKQIKKGSLPYEDEKYSYLIVSKNPCKLPRARILRHPQKRSGHVNLTLCTAQGIKQEVISKKDPELYKQVKKLDWGSDLP